MGNDANLFLFHLHLVNCEWGDYSAWTGCTKTCGTGQQYKFRAIKTHEANGGTACDPNLNVEEQECNTESCPTTGERYPVFFTQSICFILNNVIFGVLYLFIFTIF